MVTFNLILVNRENRWFPDVTGERKVRLKYSKCRLFLVNDTNGPMM
jgi:hypothetical protein